MFRYIAVAVAVKLLTVLALMGSAYAFPDLDPDKIPDLSTPATIAAVAIAILWFAKSANRPLRKGELFTFASGVTFGEIVISVGIFALMVVEAGQPFSFAGLYAAITDGELPVDASDAALVVIFGFVIGAISTFAISVFFAWFMTKNLPKLSNDFE